MPRATAIALESLAVAVLGFGLAIVANWLSPRGLSLTRDYFPVPTLATHPATGPAPAAGSPASAGPATRARLVAHGLQAISREEALTLHRDPRRAQGLVVFIDAREERAYQAGHIPGALQFDHYRPEERLPALLPLCLSAERVIVYCNGGECEDSEFAAVMLRDAGVPAANLFIYVGGISDWTAHSLPVETGPGEGFAPAAP
ncbi:MAG TPA: rhodanese-like domain-containing protein [Methylomirabilota bacterium]|nr:rhodanese-like domain-containing protein [Methylomirabilota bacterium]